jgi:hypothetical protein
MGLHYQPNLVMEGMLYGIDFMNRKSYAGTGLSFFEISGTGLTGSMFNMGNTSSSGYTTLLGGTVAFDGTNDFLNSNYSLPAQDSSTSFTWNIWFFNALSSNSSQVIMGNRITNSGLASWTKLTPTYFEFLPTYIYYPIPRYRWMNVSIVKDTTNLYYYLDGSVVASIGSTYFKESNIIKFGAAEVGEYFYGLISNAYVYGRALSSSEIKQNYNAIKGRFIYPFDIVTTGLKINLDAGSQLSYSGVGTDWYDASNNQSKTVSSGSPTFSGTGLSSNFTLNGSNQWFTTDYKLSNTSYTKIAIFQYNGTTYNIVSGGNTAQHAFWMSGTTYLHAGHNGGWSTVISTTSLAQNTWYFGAVSFNSTTGWKLYVNGRLESTSSNTATVSGTGVSVLIGAYDPGANLFNGKIAQVMVYDRALSDTEIRQNYEVLRGRYGI